MLSDLQRGVFQFNVCKNLPTLSMSRNLPAILRGYELRSTWIQHTFTDVPYVLDIVLGSREVEKNNTQSRHSKSSRFSGEAKQ